MVQKHLFRYSTCIFFIVMAGFDETFGGLTNPDFDSDWRPLKAIIPGLSTLEVDHGLGEVPIIVDVQVKSEDEPNLDFIFPGVGCAPRDDDDLTTYGGVVYVYNDKSVKVSAPTKGNPGGTGEVIYTGDGTYFTGPNQQKSTTAKVRIRAWLASSLPAPDFHKTGMNLTAGSQNVNDVYIEESHGLGDYPILAKVRTRLADGALLDWYSDGVGSSMAVYPSIYADYGFVIYGYNNETIRVWASSNEKGKLFYGSDGYGFHAEALTGVIEILAWKLETMTYTFKLTVQIGPGFINEITEYAYGYEMSDDMYLVSAVQATSGPNLGYRFPGSGALAYSTTETDPVCSYGGYVYAYTTTSIRFWRPDPVLNGGLVCIASFFGNGTNVQSDPHGVTVTTLWASSLEKVKPPVKLTKAVEWTPIESRCIEKDL